jgi:hypothetical protein
MSCGLLNLFASFPELLQMTLLMPTNSGWIPNTDLLDMDVSTIGNISSGMPKNVAQAHLIAAEQHGLDYFKDIMREFTERRRIAAAEKVLFEAVKRIEDDTFARFG